MTPKPKSVSDTEETSNVDSSNLQTPAEGGEERYVVEKVLNSRVRYGRRQYLIKWEGYSAEEATWESESNCDCQDVINEYLQNKPPRKRAGRDSDATTNGESKSTPKRARGARRATLSESMGIDERKLTKRGGESKSQNASESKESSDGVILEKEVEAKSTTTPKRTPQEHSNKRMGAKPRRSLTTKGTPGRRKKTMARNKSEVAERGGSCESDESVRERFLKTKKGGDTEMDTNTFSLASTASDRVYKLQQGREIEAILGINRENAHLLYAVQYKGTEPKHQRIELVPSHVLREHALERFVEFLEALVAASAAHVAM